MPYLGTNQRSRRGMLVGGEARDPAPVTGPCACTRDVPCLLHYAQDTDDDRLAWRRHLGITSMAAVIEQRARREDRPAERERRRPAEGASSPSHPRPARRVEDVRSPALGTPDLRPGAGAGR